MIETPMTTKAREIAERVFGDTCDKTGYPYLRKLDAIAENMDDEHRASIVYLQEILENSNLKPVDLVIEGLPLRVAFAPQRIKQNEDEPFDEYLHRIANDDLVYPIVLATADYLRNTENYSSDLITMISETAHYSMTYRFLRLYHDGKNEIW